MEGRGGEGRGGEGEKLDIEGGGGWRGGRCSKMRRIGEGPKVVLYSRVG